METFGSVTCSLVEVFFALCVLSAYVVHAEKEGRRREREKERD
jgi:hypothetical protein